NGGQGCLRLFCVKLSEKALLEVAVLLGVDRSRTACYCCCCDLPTWKKRFQSSALRCAEICTGNHICIARSLRRVCKVPAAWLGLQSVEVARLAGTYFETFHWF